MNVSHGASLTATHPHEARFGVTVNDASPPGARLMSEPGSVTAHLGAGGDALNVESKS